MLPQTHLQSVLCLLQAHVQVIFTESLSSAAKELKGVEKVEMKEDTSEAKTIKADEGKSAGPAELGNKKAEVAMEQEAAAGAQHEANEDEKLAAGASTESGSAKEMLNKAETKVENMQAVMIKAEEEAEHATDGLEQNLEEAMKQSQSKPEAADRVSALKSLDTEILAKANEKVNAISSHRATFKAEEKEAQAFKANVVVACWPVWPYTYCDYCCCSSTSLW